MKNKSIIAQVDYSTEQIMKDISIDITSAIGDSLQDIKDDTKAITNIYGQTEEISSKLRKFDGLSSSLADLKVFANESKMLAEKISPLESQLLNIQTHIEHEITNAGEKIHNGLSSVEERQTNKFAEISGAIRNAEEKVENSNNELTQKIKDESSSILRDCNEKQEVLLNIIAGVSHKLQDIEVLVQQKNEKLDERIDALQSDLKLFAEQNESQLNVLKESIEKVQVTLDIVVNLTTPFWKKWGKK